MRTTVVRLPDEKASDLLAHPREVHRFVVDPAYPEICVDKAWKEIHHALTGTHMRGEGPGSFLLIGGHPVGEEDFGYGPGRVFFSD